MKISKSTKSKAYNFIKSLIADGASGADINQLVMAISDNIDPEIGGAILMDLISNRDDTDNDIKKGKHWFGPMSSAYFKWIASDWSQYIEDNDIKGIFRFGNDTDWDNWRKQSQISDSDFSSLKKRSTEQLCVFEYWGDTIERKEAFNFIDSIYYDIQKAKKEK